MTIILQAEQADFTFEGFAFPLGDEVVVYETKNYVNGNGDYYVNGNGDYYAGVINHFSKPIVLDAHLPDLVFEGWIHNG